MEPSSRNKVRRWVEPPGGGRLGLRLKFSPGSRQVWFKPSYSTGGRTLFNLPTGVAIISKCVYACVCACVTMVDRCWVPLCPTGESAAELGERGELAERAPAAAASVDLALLALDYSCFFRKGKRSGFDLCCCNAWQTGGNAEPRRRHLALPCWKVLPLLCK